MAGGEPGDQGGVVQVRGDGAGLGQGGADGDGKVGFGADQAALKRRRRPQRQPMPQQRRQQADARQEGGRVKHGRDYGAARKPVGFGARGQCKTSILARKSRP
jgi:hypothetical protein